MNAGLSAPYPCASDHCALCLSFQDPRQDARSRYKQLAVRSWELCDYDSEIAFQQETQSLCRVGKWQESSPCPGPGQAGLLWGKSPPIPHRNPTPNAGPVGPQPRPQHPGPSLTPVGRDGSASPHHLCSPEIRKEPGCLGLIPPQMSSQLCDNKPAGWIPCLSPGGRFKDHQRGCWREEGLETGQDDSRGPGPGRGQIRPPQSPGSGLSPHPSQK